MKYAETRVERLFRIQSLYMYMQLHHYALANTNEDLLSLHAWPEGSLSYVGSVYGTQNPPCSNYKCVWLYINVCSIRLVLPHM